MTAAQSGPEWPSTYARSAPDRPAVVLAGSGRVLTYAELDDRSIRFANVLHAAGVGPGDHIAVLMENRPEVYEVCWAAQRSGIYYTLISTRLTVEEAGYVIDDCGATVLVVGDGMADLATQLRSCAPRVQRRVVVGEALDGHERYGDLLDTASPELEIEECEGAPMLYSSGTTGRPKGIKRLLYRGAPGTEFFLRPLLVDLLGFSESSVYLSPAPLYHSAPLGYSMGVQRLGGTVVLMPRFDAEQALTLIEQHRVTHGQFVPTMFVRMLKLAPEVREQYDVSSVQAAVHAAAPCPIEIKQEMIDWWGPTLYEYYAGTEANGITFITSQQWLRHPGSVGRAVIGQVHIVGENGRELGPSAVGTVYFSDGADFEYHNDPDKTADSYNELGWSTLGDVGYLDEDGFLYLTDRISHMIISGGVNIYPQETENIMTLHPAVADVAVIGVPHPEMGEEVKAVVQLLDPSVSSESLERELIEYSRARLAHYKCPRSVDFVEALPRHDNGKLYKRLLREQYRSATPS